MCNACVCVCVYVFVACVTCVLERESMMYVCTYI